MSSLQTFCLTAWSRERIEKGVFHTCKVYTRAAPKKMPSIYYVDAMSEVDVDGMEAEVEPSHQHSVTCCCFVTDGGITAV